jgi:hypothetical protein
LLWDFSSSFKVNVDRIPVFSDDVLLGQIAKSRESPIHVHSLKSPHQALDTTLRILAPDDLDASKRYPTLFVLPVHEDGLFKHGDGLMELSQLNVHNQHQIICASPSFTSKPWYVDHDQIPSKQDESHLMRTVIPFIEAHYPVRVDGEERFLIGFSKSGRGAMSLLLRHSNMFNKVVAWDPGIRIGMGPFDGGYDLGRHVRERFGSDANFESYRLSNLLKTRGKNLGKEPRLFYFNCDGVVRTWGGVQLHTLMVQEGIPHRYVMEPRRDHRWDSGWMPEAITFLFDH